MGRWADSSWHEVCGAKKNLLPLSGMPSLHPVTIATIIIIIIILTL
jgi:hypothetical protein